VERSGNSTISRGILALGGTREVKSQRTPATRIAATTPELTVGILNSLF